MNNEVTKVMEALNANRNKKAGARLSEKKVYTAQIGDMTAVLPPQAIKLVEILLTNEGPWTEVELHELIQEHKDISVKQEPWAIFKYYRKQLIESGFLTVSE